MNKEIEKVEKKIFKLGDVLDKIYNALDELYCKEEFDLGIKIFGKTPEGKKMTKKQRKEFVLDYLEKKFPQLDKQLKELSIISEAIQLRVLEAQQKIEDMTNEVDELESEKEEVERRIDDLRF